MGESLLEQPDCVESGIAGFEDDVRLFKSGSITPEEFKQRRAPWGVYEQRLKGTYMLRARIGGGVLGVEQMERLASVARQYGGGRLHVTTRQDIQLHDLAIDDLPKAIGELSAAGLTTRCACGNTVRNVTACPYAGVCPSELFDVTDFARTTASFFNGLPGNTSLPRKFKIAFSGCPADCALTRVNDLGFVAAERGGRPGFTVYAGGGMGAFSRVGNLLIDWIPADETIRVAEALRRVFDRTGDRTNRRRARLRFVYERLGVDAVRQHVLAELDRAHEEAVPSVSSPQMSALPPVPPCDPEETTESAFGMRFIRQRQEGYVSVRLTLPLGFISSEDLRALAGIASRHSVERAVRTTRLQGLLLRQVAVADLPDLARSLAALTFDAAAPSQFEYLISCAGASTCNFGICATRGAAGACADAFDRARIVLDASMRLRFYFSGCPNSCGQHAIAPVGFQAAALRIAGSLAPAYRVLVGGRAGATGTRLAQSAGSIPARVLPEFAAAVVRDFFQNRMNGEPFDTYFERAGIAHFATLTAEHTTEVEKTSAPDVFRDWGRDDVFALPPAR